MESLPSKSAANGVSFSVADLIKAGGERLRLTLVAGSDNACRIVGEPIANRPGLALTGFWKCFAWKRVQLIGNAEHAYLDSLSADERKERLRGLLERKAWIFVFTAGHHATEDDLRLAEEYGAVVLETPLATRVFSNRATFVMEQLAAPRTSVYGTMVEVCGLGVLFEGDPGLGKSETALGLIKRGAALVADDLTCVRKDVATNLLFGSASASTAGYMEIRGIGIVHVPSIFGVDSTRGEKRLQLVITFRRLEEIKGEVDRIGRTCRARRILGVDVPNVVVPVSEGRDLVNLVETAAQQQKLLQSGRDAVGNLSERLRRRAMSATAAGEIGKGMR